MKIGETDRTTDRTTDRQTDRHKQELKKKKRRENTSTVQKEQVHFLKFFPGDDKGTKKCVKEKFWRCYGLSFFVWKCLVSVWIYDRKKLCCKMSNYKIVKFPNTQRQQKN